MSMVCRSECLSQKAPELIAVRQNSISKGYTEDLLADKGHDSDNIIVKAKKGGMTPVIPPRCDLLINRNYDW